MYDKKKDRVGKAAKATLVAALVISEKLQSMHTCKILTLYDSCSLLQKNRFKGIKNFYRFKWSCNWTLWHITTRCNDFDHKLREQALSNNAVGRSCKYAYGCSWQNLDKTETHKNIRSAQVLIESSLAKVRIQLTNRRQSELSPFKELRLAHSAQGHKYPELCSQRSSSHQWYFSMHIVLLAMFDEHASEDTTVAMERNCRAYPPNPLFMR